MVTSKSDLKAPSEYSALSHDRQLHSLLARAPDS